MCPDMRRMPVSVMVTKPGHRPVGAPFSGDVMDDPGRGPRFGPIERDIASRGCKNRLCPG